MACQQLIDRRTGRSPAACSSIELAFQSGQATSTVNPNPVIREENALPGIFPRHVAFDAA